MDSFRRSYFLNTLLNAGIAFLAIIISPNTSTGMMTAKVAESFPPITYAMTTEKMSISGLRTAVRMSIMYANCTLPTSVVSLVTREAEENLSMFSKE